MCHRASSSCVITSCRWCGPARRPLCTRLLLPPPSRGSAADEPPSPPEVSCRHDEPCASGAAALASPAGVARVELVVSRAEEGAVASAIAAKRRTSEPLPGVPLREPGRNFKSRDSPADSAAPAASDDPRRCLGVPPRGAVAARDAGAAPCSGCASVAGNVPSPQSAIAAMRRTSDPLPALLAADSCARGVAPGRTPLSGAALPPPRPSSGAAAACGSGGSPDGRRCACRATISPRTLPPRAAGPTEGGAAAPAAAAPRPSGSHPTRRATRRRRRAEAQSCRAESGLRLQCKLTLIEVQTPPSWPSPEGSLAILADKLAAQAAAARPSLAAVWILLRIRRIAGRRTPRAAVRRVARHRGGRRRGGRGFLMEESV